MAIAVDLRSLMETGGKISGVENYLLNVLDRLPVAQSNKQIEYFGFCNSYRPVMLPEIKQSLTVKKTKIPNKILNAGLTFFNQPKFENLYGQFEILWLPDLRPFAISDKTKLAITVHDLSPVMHPKLYSLKRRIWHHVVRYQKSFDRANIIFAVSEYTKYDLIKIFKINPDKIKVIYSGIDHQRFNQNLDNKIKEQLRQKYNLPKRFILSISTIEPRKNISTLIAAFERIKDQDVNLVIAGRLGWLYKDLLKQIEKSPKRNQILLTGYINETDKPYLISLSEILCYPSYYEGFGFVPLEAMACGVPVISSTRTSMPEICEDAALLVEPSSLTDLTTALNALLENQSLREDFIAKGLVQAKKFNWDKTVQQINNYLMELA
ncbi:MAG: group 1 glycosyl transferase [Candidatus Doudnabacteria bacterium]|nr:group 1 glycosyl transferase [Candidatus Doudnabacteria bacterium]